MSELRFDVLGLPKGQGSMRAFVPKGWTRAVITHVKGPQLKSWRKQIADCAADIAPAEPLRGALALRVVFRLPRPKKHFGTGRRAQTLKANAPLYPSVRPDADKLMRALGDAIKGVLFHDDSQLVELSIRKEYGTPGASVALWPLDGGES